MQEYYVYILASRRNGTLYAGMAKDLASRVARHRKGRGSRFAQKYNLHNLVYYEKVGSYLGARRRERQLKYWKRKWKVLLIEKTNPQWVDLTEQLGTG